MLHVHKYTLIIVHVHYSLGVPQGVRLAGFIAYLQVWLKDSREMYWYVMHTTHTCIYTR